jgi:ribonuclease J
MLREHVKLAEEGGRPGRIATNGTMLDLTGDTPQVAEFVETGRVYLDGKVQIGALDGVVRDRIRMALNGHVLATLIIDEDGEMLGDPWCELMGLAETGLSDTALVDVLEHDLGQALGRAKGRTLADDGAIEDLARRAIRKTAMDEIGKKPEVTVVISRLS